MYINRAHWLCCADHGLLPKAAEAWCRTVFISKASLLGLMFALRWGMIMRVHAFMGAAGAVSMAAATMIAPTALADGLVPEPPLAAPSPAPLPVPQPQQVAAQPRWDGGQAGGFGGGSGLNQSFVEPGSNICPEGLVGVAGVSAQYADCPETDFRFSRNKWGGTIGLFLGYRWQFGSIVAGVESDIAFKNISESRSLDSVSLVDSPDGITQVGITRTERFRGRQSQKTDGSVRARLGVLLSPWLLAYGTGGVAFGRVCGHFSYTAALTDITFADQGAVSGASSWCDNRVGYTAGGGLEMAIHQGWTARLEYRYTDFGSYHKNIALAGNPGPGGTCSSTFSCTGNARVDLQSAFHTLRVGLAYNFTSPF